MTHLILFTCQDHVKTEQNTVVANSIIFNNIFCHNGHTIGTVKGQLPFWIFLRGE